MTLSLKFVRCVTLTVHLFLVLSDSSSSLIFLLWGWLLRRRPARVASVQNGMWTFFMLFSTATLTRLHLFIRLGSLLVGAVLASLALMPFSMLLQAELSLIFRVLHEPLYLGFGQESWWGCFRRGWHLTLWRDVTKGVLWEDLRLFFKALLKAWPASRSVARPWCDI